MYSPSQISIPLNASQTRINQFALVYRITGPAGGGDSRIWWILLE